MTPPAIETLGLSKSFGDVHAVVDLDLRVERGEVFGFLGPNGAGKSTTIKLLLDEIRPTAGVARVLGLDSHVDLLEIHRRMGYLPGELHLPGDMTGGGYLDFLAHMRGGVDREFRTELTERFGLDPSRHLGKLSTGNKQKVGLVQAFMHRPEVVMLDEPTRGLDPLVQHDFHELLAELAAAGTTIFLSSHTLSEIDRVAERVGIIREGRLVAVDTVAALKNQKRSRIELEFRDAPDPSLRQVPGVISAELDGCNATVVVEGPVDALLRHALTLGPIISIRTLEADLEDVFLDYYREATPR